MKNIGIRFKEKREENGLSIEEVAVDLKMRPSQIESIEEGRTEDFKDVFYLKYFIRDYAKYLGMDGEKILDEFNEYLFDITSKIPVDLINEAKKEKKGFGSKKLSPYTNGNTKFNISKPLIIIIIVIILIIAGYVIISNHHGNDFSDTNITYSIRR